MYNLLGGCGKYFVINNKVLMFVNGFKDIFIVMFVIFRYFCMIVLRGRERGGIVGII